VTFEELLASVVKCIRSVDEGVERSGVDDQRDRRLSARRISSIRTEMSRSPLRPAAADKNFRRSPPTIRSIAARVRSEIVTPRRSASCRSRASSQSGNFTVVRRMVCQHIKPSFLTIPNSVVRLVALDVRLLQICLPREYRPVLAADLDDS